MSKKGGNYNNDRKQQSKKEYWVNQGKKDAVTITRQVYTEAEQARIEEITQNMGSFTKAFENIDEKDKKMRDIRLILFAITAENYEECRDELIAFCKEKALVSDIIKVVIERAWTQAQFTKVYASLIFDLGNHTYDWCALEKKGDEPVKYDTKQFKNMVIELIRREFFGGFKAFKNYIISIEENKDLDATEKFERYVKKKNKLMGNIGFIAELHLLKYLPIKVMKFITYNLVFYFTKHLIESSKQVAQFPIEEEYLEALIKLFD